MNVKKDLLTVAAVFYAIMYSIFLLYRGYMYGDSKVSFGEGLFYFIVLVVYLTLFGRSMFLVNNRVYSGSYYRLGGFTLVNSCLSWGIRLLAHSEGRLYPDTPLHVYIYPGAMFFCSVIIFVIYLVCGRMTHKEDKLA